jgi:hypothetical protein
VTCDNHVVPSQATPQITTEQHSTQLNMNDILQRGQGRVAQGTLDDESKSDRKSLPLPTSSISTWYFIYYVLLYLFTVCPYMDFYTYNILKIYTRLYYSLLFDL